MKPYTVTLTNATERHKAVTAVCRAPEGYRVTFQEPTHSSEQRRKFHAMVDEVSEQVEYYGSKRTPAVWKSLFCATYEKAEILPSLDGHGFVQVRRSTTTYGVKEYADLIEIVYAYGASKGVVFNEREVA